MGNIGRKRQRIGTIKFSKKDGERELKKLKEKMKEEKNRYGKSSYKNLRIRKRRLPIWSGKL